VTSQAAPDHKIGHARARFEICSGIVVGLDAFSSGIESGKSSVQPLGVRRRRGLSALTRRERRDRAGGADTTYTGDVRQQDCKP
jgi:hypothetical protein